MLKADFKTREEKGINYLVKNGKAVRYMPWMGDLLARFYDPIMSRKVFPGKFNADMERHFTILRKELDGIRGKKVLEIGTGSGSAVHFLNPDNGYTGLDISSRLLRKAMKTLEAAGFGEPGLYVASAGELPFENDSFDLCLCILALNFFDDIPKVLGEVHRVLLPGGTFIGAVPVPERTDSDVRIRGTFISESRIAEYAAACGLDYHGLNAENGALLYFRMESH